MLNYHDMEAAGFHLPNASHLDSLPADELCAMDWAKRRAFVEVHANINFYRFTIGVLPLLPRLRRAYAACGCLLHTSALVREPVSHIVSAYRYFHLRDSARAPTTELRPLADWRARALARLRCPIPALLCLWRRGGAKGSLSRLCFALPCRC